MGAHVHDVHVSKKIKCENPFPNWKPITKISYIELYIIVSRLVLGLLDIVLGVSYIILGVLGTILVVVGIILWTLGIILGLIGTTIVIDKTMLNLKN